MAEREVKSIERQREEVETSQGSLQTHVAYPRGSDPWPGVLLVHEIFGLTPHIEDMADRLASAGYFAAAPDLFTNDSAHNSLTVADIEAGIAAGYSDDPDSAVAALPSSEREGARAAMAWRAALGGRSESLVETLADVLGWLRARQELSGQRAASIGWCFGGGLNGALACTGAPLDAAVIYYGAPPDPEKVQGIECPVLGHYGSEDPRITNQVPAFGDAMQAAGKQLTSFIYDAPHAFNNDSRASYRPHAARIAWERTLAFLTFHLRNNEQVA